MGAPGEHSIGVPRCNRQEVTVWDSSPQNFMPSVHFDLEQLDNKLHKFYKKHWDSTIVSPFKIFSIQKQSLSRGSIYAMDRQDKYHRNG